MPRKNFVLGRDLAGVIDITPGPLNQMAFLASTGPQRVVSLAASVRPGTVGAGSSGWVRVIAYVERKQNTDTSDSRSSTLSPNTQGSEYVDPVRIVLDQVQTNAGGALVVPMRVDVQQGETFTVEFSAPDDGSNTLLNSLGHVSVYTEPINPTVTAPQFHAR